MKQIIKVEGVLLEVETTLPKEGQLYVAQRNNGPRLLTAKKIDLERGYVVPSEEFQYVFDLHECKRVIRMIE